MAAKVREGKEVTLIPVGRKGRDFFRKKASILNERTDVFGKFDISLAVQIAKDIIPPFIRKNMTNCISFTMNLGIYLYKGLRL